MIYWFDPLLYVILAPPLVVGLWAWLRIAMASKRSGQLPDRLGRTGSQAAHDVFRGGGISGVDVIQIEGELTDYYHARTRCLRLSQRVHDGKSATALGLAIHESGHAVQQSRGRRALMVRALIAPAAALGSGVFWIMIIPGYGMGVVTLFQAAIGLLWINLLLQFLILPIEIDASRLGISVLLEAGVISADDAARLKPALDAAVCRGLTDSVGGAFGLARGLISTIMPPELGAVEQSTPKLPEAITGTEHRI
jgi:uncharacterized protein